MTDQEIDESVYAVVIGAGRVIGTIEVKNTVDIYYNRVTRSLVRLSGRGLIFEHGRARINGTHQNTFAAWPKTSRDNQMFDMHPLSVCWPVKVFVPKGIPRKPHRPLFDGERDSM